MNERIVCQNKSISAGLLLLMGLMTPHHVSGTSMKMDFLPLGDVRTDPIISPTCLSDHVHTFYGASAIRPETTYEDLRDAYGNSGNVLENKSLYWHPTAYEYDANTGIYKKDPIFFGSAYYVWETGQATAFPDGFKMVAGFLGDPLSRAEAECVEPSPCERDNCDATDTSFFPSTACAELEVSMIFPTCWDGINIDSEDHMSHVSYDTEGGRFDGDCPAEFPVKLPEIHFYFRIVPYSGGQHIFSDGTPHYHSDYFSGWKESELQKVLDECSNDSDAANPDAFCEDFVTFRDAPKGGGGEDTDIVAKLEPLQPDPPIDTTTITDEVIDGTNDLPRGECTGTLKPDPGDTLSPVASPTTSAQCTDSKLKMLMGRKKRLRGCNFVAKNAEKLCQRKNVAQHCPKACDSLKDSCAQFKCEDSAKKFKMRKSWLTKNCKFISDNPDRCSKGGVTETCRATCGYCDS